MKRILYWLFMLPLFALLGGCDDTEEIVFDDEQPQFEIKSDAILLEVIMPQGSAADDSYYIVGDFNGGASEAVGQLEWQLEKASGSDTKWGIYLNPSTFKDGKTLADGFTFVSAAKGAERSVKNEEVKHTLEVTVGTRTNVFVERWAAYFEVTEEGGHDGHVIYVQDKSGWDALALYAWDSNGDVFAPWPGIQVKGTEVINGVTYKYFDLGESFTGREGINLIFNNNNGGFQFDGPSVTIDRDFYFRITDATCEEVDPNASYRIYVDDQTGWNTLSLLVEESGDEWPGMEPVGTKEINGVTYKYFETSVELMGQNLTLVFNNGDDEGLRQSFSREITFSRDFYYCITADKCEEIDPATHGTSYNIYVLDNTNWGALALYSWGSAEVFGGWPGAQASGTLQIGGTVYQHFPLKPNATGAQMHLIFNNNNGGTQFDGPFIDGLDRDYYLRITDGACEEITGCTIYVQDKTTWGALAMYSWGDVEACGGWPGMQPETKEIGGTTYQCFDLSAHFGKNVNLIFNNNNGGTQFDGPNINLVGDIYLSITDEGWEALPQP